MDLQSRLNSYVLAADESDIAGRPGLDAAEHPSRKAATAASVVKRRPAIFVVSRRMPFTPRNAHLVGVDRCNVLPALARIGSCTTEPSGSS